MKILYHITNLPPRIPGTEAILQEIDMLRGYFGGNLVNLNPNQQFPLYLPRILFGWHKLKQIRFEETGIHLHHLYNADPFPFPIALWLNRPVVYSISSGIGSGQRLNKAFFNSLAAVTVSDERSLKLLQARGISNSHLVLPGIDMARFSCSPLTLGSEIRLMVGSAPWTRAQFKTKGIDALLSTTQEMPNLHLICLWRGVLADELKDRVRRMKLERQVEIINKKVDVNNVLARVHASITLVTNPAIIRSYPHSLMESLAAGKPVIVSRSIPMSDYVELMGCGQVVEQVRPDEIICAIERLIQNYPKLQRSARQVGQRDFSVESSVASFQKVYGHILAGIS